VAAAREGFDIALRDGLRVGPLEALPLAGHAPDHFVFILGAVGFTGDAVLGQGSVFISPHPGALRRYLDGLARLQERDLDFLAPGHGPLVKDPRDKLEGYRAHRLERERRLVAALGEGSRTVDGLLDRVWDDAPVALRPAAALTLAAHLDKLEDEGRLPPDVERPDVSWLRPGPGSP